jgi:NurA-like 5'-3' nuclease
MAKQRSDNKCRDCSPNNPSGAIGDRALQYEAELLLQQITHIQGIVTMKMGAYNAAVTLITEKYKSEIAQYNAALESNGKELIALMKKNKGILFAVKDVINLESGSLIHNVGDHVTIPKTALEACKENKFNDVIKVVESLDRDAIVKWPDARLALIGAERTKKHQFNYTVKS